MSDVVVNICFGGMAMPGKNIPKAYKKPSLVEKIKETIQYIKDEPYEAKEELKWLNDIRQKLASKDNEDARNLVRAIDEALNKLSMRV